MAIDRETTLRRAEKLLRQGRLEAAIGEYQQVVEDQPGDWNTANILGDLYVRAGQIESAVRQYTRVAEHFAREGFFQKASALYKKIVKIRPDDEHALLQSADLSEQQGLFADAKACLAAIADRRRLRGDRRGAAEIALRLTKLDPADVTLALQAARAAADLGDPAGAAARFKSVAADLMRRGRAAEGLAALSDAAALDPGDAELRVALMRASLDAGQIERARQYAVTGADFKAIAAALASQGREREALDVLLEALRIEPADAETHIHLARAYLARGDLDHARRIVGLAPAGVMGIEVQVVQAELELRGGRADEARRILAGVLDEAATGREAVVSLGLSLSGTDPDAAFQCVDLVSDAAVAADDWRAAASTLRAFLARVPEHVPALMKLVEVCVDGGLDATMDAAQAHLADAYLSTGRAAEARVIAEDLVAREPWRRENIDRFRRALLLLGEVDPDRVIADHLSGESPFMGTDVLEDPDDRADAVGGFEALLEPGAAPAGADIDVSVEPPLSEPSSRPAQDRDGGHVQDVAGETEAIEHPEEPAAEALPAPIGVLADAGPETDAVQEEEEEAAIAEVEVDLSDAIGQLRGGIKPGAIAGTTDAASAPAVPTGDLERVFELFRDEAAALGLADAGAQHLKLAMTYRDMGMISDCVRSLEVAARSPRHRFEAASGLAQTYRDQGRIREAVEWFERAAEAPAPSTDAGRRLLYELGRTLSDAGESERALAVFLELQADAPEYRDVAAWVRRLSSTS